MWKMIFLAGVSVAALASTAAEAATFVFTGSVQTYNVTTTGLYVLRAAGAQGGTAKGGGSAQTTPGGAGALVSGRLSLASGTTLNVVVGGQGGSFTGFGSGGGGGGGTFIYRDLATPLAIAGGGGGSANGYSGGSGRDSGDGGNSAGNQYYVSFGGSGGSGGEGSQSSGGGGGGGGGFSGGAGYNYGGGGGGSFLTDAATHELLQAGVNTGDGFASIELFQGAVPEPSSWAMLITGFGGIGAMLRRRRLRIA